MTKKETGAGRPRRPPSRRPPPRRPIKRDPTGDTPMTRLSRATKNGALVHQEDLQAVLAAHAFRADCQAPNADTRDKPSSCLLSENPPFSARSHPAIIET